MNGSKSRNSSRAIHWLIFLMQFDSRLFFFWSKFVRQLKKRLYRITLAFLAAELFALKDVAKGQAQVIKTSFCMTKITPIALLRGSFAWKVRLQDPPLDKTYTRHVFRESEKEQQTGSGGTRSRRTRREGRNMMDEFEHIFEAMETRLHQLANRYTGWKGDTGFRFQPHCAALAIRG